MRKFFILISVLTILLISTGCQNNSSVTNPDNTSSGGTPSGTGENAVFSNHTSSASDASALQLLHSDLYPYCINENGYYYRTKEATQLKDGSYAYHLMYMDFKTQQEIYLCSNTGCQHDTEDCTAVLTENDIAFDSRLFFYDNYLYLLSSDYDSSGSLSIGEIVPDESSGSVETTAALYRMNPDGTGREKVHEFEIGLTLENNMILGDSTGLYFVTKKPSTQRINNTATYYTSTDRKLIRLSTDSWKEETIYEFDASDTSEWNICGCFDTSFVFVRTLYEQDLSASERILLDDDAYRDVYNHSKEEFAILNPADGSLTTVYTVPNDPLNSYAQRDHMLYVSVDGEDSIRQVDLRTGKSSTLSSIKNSYIFYCFQDVICCQDWTGEDDTFYFVNRKDGSVSHSGLVNQSLGWSLDFRGETQNDFLVIYDYDATPSGDDSYEILQYKYALIAKDDLYAGNENYRPITMIGTGE